LVSLFILMPCAFHVLTVTFKEHKLLRSSSCNFLLLFRRSLSLRILLYLFTYKSKKIITNICILALSPRMSLQSEVFLKQLPRNRLAHLLRGKKSTEFLTHLKLIGFLKMFWS
jgi:hypothetical protein